MQVGRARWRCGLFAAFLLGTIHAVPVPRRVRTTCGQMFIESDRQTLYRSQKILFSGDVVIRIDGSLHVTAERAIFDNVRHLLCVYAPQAGVVKVENQDLLILARSFVYSLKHRRGDARQLRVQTAEWQVRARRALYNCKGLWILHRLVYTPCLHRIPHWSLSARRAILKDLRLIKVASIQCNIVNVPLLAIPVFTTSLDKKKSSSGFTLPRFYFDRDYGFGLKAEHYWAIAEHADNSLGTYWRQKRGYVIWDEGRWAASAQNYACAKILAAHDRDAIIERAGRLERGGENDYWIEGVFFQPWVAPIGKGQCLMRADIGTDKSIAYKFFNDTTPVEDVFYNTWIMRLHMEHQMVQFLVDADRTRRTYVRSNMQNSVQREVVEKVSIYRIPQVQWSSAYTLLSRHFFCRHDVFSDCAFLDDVRLQRDFCEKSFIKESGLCHENLQRSARLGYRVDIGSFFDLGSTRIEVRAMPQFQFRSNVLPNSLSQRGKFFWETSVNVLPQDICVREIDSGNLFFLKPSISWNFIPKTTVHDWLYFDVHDRVWPKNELAGECHVNAQTTWGTAQVVARQGYDFFSAAERFLLRRDPVWDHVLPLALDFSTEGSWWAASASVEWSWSRKTIPQLYGDFACKVAGFEAHVGYLYASPMILHRRELLADVPHFLTTNIVLNLGRLLKVHYEGTWYALARNSGGSNIRLHPLSHACYVTYRADCWECMIGFEEKRYREIGQLRSEQAIVLSIRLKTIGSVAQRFRQAAYQFAGV